MRLSSGRAILLATTLFAPSFAQNSTDGDVITSDTYFYGQSPYVVAPDTSGLGDWAEAYAKAVALVKQLTLEEKVNITGGYGAGNGAAGNIPPIPRVGFPGMALADAGNGVRNTDFVSGFASGISVGASWNKRLSRARGAAMAAEFRAKGNNVLLGPVVGPLGRTVLAGRNWEGFSVDPYLSGELARHTVTGARSRGVITSTKHYIGNEQETNRMPGANGSFAVQSVSSNIDDKTLHELYLWPFADAVRAGTGSVMCSYQRINNSYACANSKLQNGVLKTELGFQGFIVSDWGAQYSGVATALGGMDMVMPGPTYWGDSLITAVRNGSVPESRVDDMATRIFAAWYHAGQDINPWTPGFGMPIDIQSPHVPVDGRDRRARPTILQGAVEGHVLVKNIRSALPLKRPRSINLFGYSATVPRGNTPSSGPFYALGGSPLGPEQVIGVAQIATGGTVYGGGGSGAITPSYISSPYESISRYAQDNDIALYWDFSYSSSSRVAGAPEACIVFLNAVASEIFDRTTLSDPTSDALVTSVASQCNNTIVVIHNPGTRLVDSFADNPNVTAILFAHLPGQDSGNALVRILAGKVSPSGRLPYTVARNESDYGAALQPVKPAGKYAYFPQDDFSEGGLVDYRRFDALGISPRYEFGFGLTYTTFSYADLSVGDEGFGAAGQFPTGEIVPGGREDLYEVLACLTVTLTNTGVFAAAEVPQLYVTIPNARLNVDTQEAPVGRQLRGFEKVWLKPGQSETVRFELRRRDLSQWDVAAQEWGLEKGEYKIEVGASSRDIKLTGTLTR